MVFKRIILILLLIVSGNSYAEPQTISFEGAVTSITKYEISFPKEIIDLIPGFNPGIGSGLQFKEKTPNGHLLFYSITDRGPGASLKNIRSTKDNVSEGMFFYPKFSPFISLIDVKLGKGAQVIKYKIITKDKQPISGISTIKNDDNIKEIPFDENFEEINNANFGLDTESIAIDKKDNFWVGEEYEPSLNYIDHNTGEIIKTYTPGNGLPYIFKHRQKNRGFEAVAVVPNGKVYAILESTIDINNETKNSAQFIRMLELDPLTGKTKTFAYPWNKDELSEASKTKISELAAINDEKFLVIEQGVNKEGKVSNKIYKIDISNAIDISTLKLPNSKDLEYANENELKGIHMVKKEMFLDLRKYGWLYEKSEGLTVIDDKTIAVTNDNDFGIEDVQENKQCNDKSCKKLVPIFNNAITELWIINLRDSF
jgi:hypothetical protein